MGAWVERIHYGEERLSKASLYIENLIYCFDQCGNDKMSNNLRSLKDDIDVANSEIHSGAGECLDQMLNAAERSSQNVLASALAGIELGKSKKKGKK